jgi:hypothetical protein
MKEKILDKIISLAQKNKTGVKLASNEEINNFITNVDNKRLNDLEKNLSELVNVLNELIRVERDTQEFLVQLATSVQEIEHILDTKVIMMAQQDEMAMGMESDPISMIIQKPRKKMMN